MELWQQMVRDSIFSLERFMNISGFEIKNAEKVNQFFQTRISIYYLSLIRYVGDPIWKQCVPSEIELEDVDGELDPLLEDAMSPVPNIIHRFANRCLFLITSQCGVYCRFCNRKRKVGDADKISMKLIESAFIYIENHSELDEIILSGGDPFMLTDFMLEKILKRLRSIPHIKIIRIETRMPCVLPHRITPKLCNIIKQFHPVYIHTQFNHPWEITPESKKACELLINAGCPINNQAVLLRDVNDDEKTIEELMIELSKMRVNPYRLVMAENTLGSKHFRTTISEGLNIVESLKKPSVSELALPQFFIDNIRGEKISLLPKNNLKSTFIDRNSTIFISYASEDFNIADRLADTLEIFGFSIWFDKKSLLPGDNWKSEIRKAIKNCRYIILLLSNHSVSKKGEVQREFKLALEEQEKYPENEIFIIPARLDNCSPANEKLKELHWVDLFIDWNKGITRITKSLGK